MRRIAPAALAAVALAGLPALPASATTSSLPTVTGVTLGIHNVITSPTASCAEIPISISYNTHGDFVYQVDVYVTRNGVQPPATVPPAAQLTPTSTTGTHVSGTFQYCPSTQGVGVIDAGPIVFHYATPTEVGQSTVADPHVTHFDVRQTSVATIHAKRRQGGVILTATEHYYNYTNETLTRTTAQKAIFQRAKGSHWKTIGTRKPSATKGYARLVIKSSRTHRHNFRVTFVASTTIAGSVSAIVTK